MDDDRYVTWDAAYVLGSLSSDERLEYEAHLADCPRCQAAVAELSGIPALLAHLDPEEVEALDDIEPEATALRSSAIRCWPRWLGGAVGPGSSRRSRWPPRRRCWPWRW